MRNPPKQPRLSDAGDAAKPADSAGEDDSVKVEKPNAVSGSVIEAGDPELLRGAVDAEEQEEADDDGPGTAAPSAASAGSSAAAVADPTDHNEVEVSRSPKKVRKRPPEPLADGLCQGAQVWARWSGIKFSHGVISKLLTSSKWVLVTFDNETSQWVTTRDLVPDQEPDPENVLEGVECIAAWEEDAYFYKGSVIGTSYKGRFRVRFDDWDEQVGRS